MNTRGGTIGTATPALHGTRVPCQPRSITGSGRAPYRLKDPPGTGGALRPIYDDTPPRTRGGSTTLATHGWGDDTATLVSPLLARGPDDGRQTSGYGTGHKRQ